MPSIQATLVRNGLVQALSLVGVTDGTDLNGWNSWQVYENGGSGNGFYEIRAGEIRQTSANTTQLALWGLGAVGLPGQCIAAEVYSTNWGDYQGLVANGKLDHSDDIRAFLFNTWEIRHRSGSDYGQGFLVGTGTLTGQPFTTGQWYDAKFGVIQDTGASHPRVSGSFNEVIFQADNTTSTGINDGSLTYPGLISWAGANEMRWRNLRVTHDYRLSVTGLTGTMGFRLYDSGGTVVQSSSAQSGNEAHVNLIDLPWPFVGYLQIFNDAGTWADSAGSRGRWPASDTASIYGGHVIELPSFTFAVQVNTDNTAAWPDFWTIPASKNWTLDVVDIVIEREAANPDIGADTLTLTLRDPDRKYVPAKTDSPLYPNLRLNRPVRVVVELNGTYYPLFYGTIASYKPQGQFGERATVVRAESPLRAVANAQVQATITAAVIVGDDQTSGAVWEALEAIRDLVDAAHRTLDPSPDAVPSDLQTQPSEPASTLQQLAIVADALYGVHPRYRTLTDDPDWVFFWQYRDAKLAVTADWTWDAATDGLTWDAEYTGEP